MSEAIVKTDSSLEMAAAQAEPPTMSETVEIQDQESSTASQIKGVVADALDRFAQNGSMDQLRGYANEALGETKLGIGLAISSPEIALLGMAQKALGQAQRYIGEAKLAEEAAIGDEIIPVEACAASTGEAIQ